MITSVHSVLVGKTCPSSFSDVNALNPGDVALFDQDRKLITTAAAAADATSLYIGVAGNKINVTLPNGSVEQKANIEFSNEIQRAGNPSAVIGEYAAPVQEKIDIDFTSATIVAGNRYVIRIVYKDIYEDPSQFTHTYEVYAADTTAENLANAFKAKINAHKNRRVEVSTSSAKLTLTAMAKDDNEGVYSINEYSVVSMEATLYTTIPGALLSNYPESVPGAVITKTKGNPGKGYWKQVRDAEVRNMGYKGHVFSGAYPIIEQERKVVVDAEYDYAILHSENKYLSNDNQYVKNTPITIEVYCPGLHDSTIVAAGIKNFIAGEAA
jgi:hypothetical protein